MKVIRIFRTIKRERLLLFLITMLSLSLNTLHLNREGYGNLYYAAGIKSMLENWHNFFYLAYDPGGFVSIDKPPLGFWLQALSAKIFGFHGWALILPQILAGVVSVLILYRLVSRVFGANSGLIASLILAVTPISVATARNNTIDSLLVFAVLAAAWMLFKAIEHREGLHWVIASAIMIGLAFNIKMLEAYLVLPAFLLLIILQRRMTKLQKLKQLSIAAVILIFVSLMWAVIVDLTPINLRPYVGSTKHNSVLELMLQHNAVDRFNGVNNPFRLFTPDLGGQISWLLPLAVLSAVFMLWKAPLLRPMRLNLQQRNVLFWLAWLIPMVVSFGAATLFHRYYTVMMAPAIAALSGVGLVRLWLAAVKRKRSGWILFAGILLLSMFAITIAWSYPQLRLPLSFTIGGIAAASLLALAFMLLRQQASVFIRTFAKVTCLLVLLVGPFVWSVTPSVFGATGSDPVAGPELINRQVANPETMEDEKLTDFLLAHYVKGHYLVATLKAETSSPFILDTGLPVLTLGGYSGSDPILTQGNLQLLAQKGVIQYFLVSKSVMIDKNKYYAAWIERHCRIVDDSEFYSKSSKLNDSIILYQYTGQMFMKKNEFQS
ncbi:MAG: glycosyl transferase family 39 [Bacilli bacterium]|nr:glycosyl transferase family 39 [Bacilli bacterium]